MPNSSPVCRYLHRPLYFKPAISQNVALNLPFLKRFPDLHLGDAFSLPANISAYSPMLKESVLSFLSSNADLHTLHTGKTNGGKQQTAQKSHIEPIKKHQGTFKVKV